MGQEVLGVEHIQLVLRGKGVGQKLVGPKRRAVLGIQEPVFTRRDRNHLFILDLIDDIDEKPGMPAGGQNFGLRTLFAVGRDDVFAG